MTVIRQYPCIYTPEPVKVDGQLDDAVWQTAECIPFYIAATDREPLSRTDARIAWDDEYLYVGFRAYDKDIWSYLEERDSATCTEDVLEIFLQTDPDKEPYLNFEINALGTIYDAYSLNRHAGGEDCHRWRRWNCEGLQVGIFIKGTLNDPSDVDEYWQLEVAIPFAELPPLKGKRPEPGDCWKFHLGRYDYSVYLEKGVELSSTALLSAVDFHQSEEWDILRFEK